MDSLTLMDYSDRELLHIVFEESTPTGWASTEDVADRLGLKGKRASQHVGARLAWMRRYGAVQRHPTKVKKWSVTPVGRALMNGQLTSDSLAALDGLDSAQLLMLTRYLTARYRRIGQTAGHLIRREWRRGTHRR